MPRRKFQTFALIHPPCCCLCHLGLIGHLSLAVSLNAFPPLKVEVHGRRTFHAESMQALLPYSMLKYKIAFGDGERKP
jgi:hypothetical protein